ncbi:MAG: ABC transporter substrate-binding protein [Dissulfuribacterales bacterium]
MIILCTPVLAVSEETEPKAFPSIALFISKNIRPYVEAADGIRSRFDQTLDADVQVFMLDRYADKAKSDLADRLVAEGNIGLVVAVGPEAAAFVWKKFTDERFLKIYSIILNPQKVIATKASEPGISLNIPPFHQLKRMHQGLPSVKRIGIFYDPANNAGFFNEASVAASTLGLHLVPLSVSSKKQIPKRLQQCWQSVDCIWLIPDRTVISESIALYIIKQAVLQRVPVVGYNQFFYESGAAMAFVFDYKSLGRQTADLAIDMLGHQDVVNERVPVFQTWLNKAVLEKLEIAFSQPLISPIMFGP